MDEYCELICERIGLSWSGNPAGDDSGMKSIQHIVLISVAGAIYGMVLPLIISSVTACRALF